MPESNWSPLAYFRELHLLPRVVFTVGGVLFLSAVVARELGLILCSIGILFAAVGFNFVESFFQALIALSIAAVCLYIATYQYRHGVLPQYLQSISADKLNDKK
jgi:hypothetical protein